MVPCNQQGHLHTSTILLEFESLIVKCIGNVKCTDCIEIKKQKLSAEHEYLLLLICVRNVRTTYHKKIQPILISTKKEGKLGLISELVKTSNLLCCIFLIFRATPVRIICSVFGAPITVERTLQLTYIHYDTMLAETCIDLSPPSWGPVINQKKGEEGRGVLGLCKQGKMDDNFAGKRGTLAT